MPPATQSQRRRRTVNQEDSDASDDDHDGDVEMDRAADGTGDQLVKKLVRYALACEYARIPIRRDGIRDKGGFKQYVLHVRTFN